jgi:lipopolysaccharide biosynthesis protein
VYFAFEPQGRMLAHHRQTLSRLHAEGLHVLVVLASSGLETMDGAWRQHSHAMLWKGTAGFDFSGYALALEHLVKHSPGAKVLLFNDSVFAPLAPLRPLLQGLQPGLTGFTASGHPEPHIQSYAFALSPLPADTLQALRPVMRRHLVLVQREDVIACQELLLARTAAAHMPVRALVYAPTHDPTQAAPFELLERGLPFLKRSLLAARSSYGDKAGLAAWLSAHGVAV